MISDDKMASTSMSDTTNFNSVPKEMNVEYVLCNKRRRVSGLISRLVEEECSHELALNATGALQTRV